MTRSAMRAIRIREPGGPEVLEPVERPLPAPGKHEVRVRVAASGINRADLLQRMGAYPAPPGCPADVPGLEFAGVIDAVGEEAEGRIGDPVMGIVGGGGYADAVVVHGRLPVPIPSGMSASDAGAVPEAFMTAYDALHRQMELAMGETVLIHAVGSGVGSAAAQLAHAAGARVIGTSRTASKLERASAFGMDHGLLLTDEGWPRRVLELTDGRGADVALDLVGGPHLPGTLKALAVGGRAVVVGTTAGASVPLDLRVLMGRRLTIAGTVLRSRPLEEKIALARDFAGKVGPLFQRGALRPVIDRFYRPEEAGEAHRRLASNDTFGKLVILWE